MRARLDYYVALGVTDLYLSPILRAAPGSTHGYDVVDHAHLSEVMGGRRAFERMSDAAHARGLGIIVDVVPNHMGIPTPEYHNGAFWSVLAEGMESPYASWFDIDWAAGRGRVLMPILGGRVEEVLGAGQLSTDRIAIPGHGDRPQAVLRYYDHVLPVRPGNRGAAPGRADAPPALSAGVLAHSGHRAELPAVLRRQCAGRAPRRVRRRVRRDACPAPRAVRTGHIDGFRVDHPDGLADPRQYFARMAGATGGAWVVAEKILEADEEIPAEWQVAGTTGYDALWRVQSLFVDPAGDRRLGALMEKLTGDERGDLPGIVRQAKREIVETVLQRGGGSADHPAGWHLSADVLLREHTRRALRECVTALLVELDRYRAYVVPGEAPSRTQRRRHGRRRAPRPRPAGPAAAQHPARCRRPAPGPAGGRRGARGPEARGA